MIYENSDSLPDIVDDSIKSFNENWEELNLINKYLIISVTDAKGVIQEVNETFCEISQYSRDELLGKTHSVINSKYHPKEFWSDLWSSISSGKIWKGEIKNRSKDGNYYWVDTIIIPAIDESNKIIRYYSFRNVITQRKKEFELLLEDNVKYRNLFEKTDQGILIHDSDGKILLANHAAETILGFTLEQMYGRSTLDSIWKTIKEDGSDYPGESHPAYIALKTGKEIHNSIMGVYHPIKKDYVWIKVSAVPLFKKDNTPYQIHVTFEDITEYKQTEKELIRGKNIAEDASKEKTQFLSVLSHEIRTPIFGILSTTEMLMRNMRDGNDLKYLEVIQTSGKVLLNIFNDILDYSKIDTGRFHLDSVDFNFKHFMEEIVEFVGTMNNNRLDLVYDIDSSIPEYFNSDPARLKQVLLNLLLNAMKFTEKGRIELHCKLVETRNILSVIKFSIKDTGIGISKSDQKKLFRPFSQVDQSSARSYGGAGLGLAISSRIVQLFSGELMVESEEGKGSNFYFTVSLRNANLLKQGIFSKIENAIRSSSADNLEFRILVAEDYPINQLIIEQMFSNLGYKIEIANNGIEVLEKLEKKRFDIIFMDVEMPEMDGIETTQKIRENTKYDGLKIIALTAYTNVKEQCMNAGMNDFVSKPFSSEELRSVILKWAV